MSEMDGHYARGIWVPDPTPEAAVKPVSGVKPDSIPDKQVSTHMSETNGHYENGRWITDSAPVTEAGPEPVVKSDPVVKPEQEAKPEPETRTEPEPKSEAAPTVDAQRHEASRSVRKAVNDVMNAGHRLLGTPEGHEQIEQAARKAGEDLERAINGWAESARRALQRQ